MRRDVVNEMNKYFFFLEVARRGKGGRVPNHAFVAPLLFGGVRKSPIYHRRRRRRLRNRARTRMREGRAQKSVWTFGATRRPRPATRHSTKIGFSSLPPSDYFTYSMPPLASGFERLRRTACGGRSLTSIIPFSKQSVLLFRSGLIKCHWITYCHSSFALPLWYTARC